MRAIDSGNVWMLGGGLGEKAACGGVIGRDGLLGPIFVWRPGLVGDDVHRLCHFGDIGDCCPKMGALTCKKCFGSARINSGPLCQWRWVVGV